MGKKSCVPVCLVLYLLVNGQLMKREHLYTCNTCTSVNAESAAKTTSTAADVRHFPSHREPWKPFPATGSQRVCADVQVEGEEPC